MIDVFKVAEIFISYAIKTYGDEVGIIAYYGSYATGTPSPTSDLDLIYIPDEGKAASLFTCFVVEGVCFDFFPISWERAERLATGQSGWAVGPSMIGDAQVLYARSDADLARFDGLKARIAELQKPEQKPQMVQRALDHFKDVLFHLGNLHLAAEEGDLSDLRRAGWNVLTNAVECLALVNQTCFKRGWDSNLEEILRLEVKSADLESMIVAIATSPEPAQIIQTAQRLVSSTRRLLRQAQEETAGQKTVADFFTDYYPEMRDKVNKLLVRCEDHRTVGASWVATFLQDEVSLFMEQASKGVHYAEFNLYSEYATQYRQLGIPELMQYVASDDAALLAKQAERFDQAIRKWLHSKSIPLNILAGVEELQPFMAERTRSR
jgi:hypothetical protein